MTTHLCKPDAEAITLKPFRAADLLVLFLTGAIAGIAYDYIHVFYDVLRYRSPHFAGTSLWVPVEFGGAALAAAFAVRVLQTRFVLPHVTSLRVAFDALLLAVAYLCTGVLNGNNRLTTLVVLPIAALAVFTRPSRLVFVVSFVAAILGPLSETVVSKLGLFYYVHSDPVPEWLPLLWTVAAALFTDVVLKVLGQKSGSTASSRSATS